MKDIGEIRDRVLKYLNSVYDLSESGDEVILTGEERVEIGMVFYYNSKKFKETGDFAFMLMGNKPILYCNSDESLMHIRSDIDLKDAIHEVKKQF